MSGGTSIKFEIIGDASRLESAATKGSSSLERMGHGISRVSSLAKGFVAFEAAKKAADFIGDATKAAIEDENAMTRTGVAVKNAGENWSKLKGPIDDALTKMSNTSGFMKSDLANSFAKLEQVTHNHNQALRELADAENVAAQRGIPLAAATKAIQGAELGSASAAKKLGIAQIVLTTSQDKVKAKWDAIKASVGKLTPVQKAQEAQELKNAKAADKHAASLKLLDKIHKTFAGGVEARSKTMAGKMAIFDAQWENTKVRIGDAILPLLTKGMSLLLEAFNFLGNNKTVAAVFEGIRLEGLALSAWVEAHWPQIKATTVAAMQAIRNAWDNDLHPALQAIMSVTDELLTFVQDHWNQISGAIKGQLKGIADVIHIFTDLLKGDWGAAWQDVVNVVKDALNSAKAIIELGWTILEAAAKALGEKIYNGFTGAVSGVTGWLEAKVAALGQAILDKVESIGAAALKLGEKVLSSITSGAGDLASAIGQKVGAIPGAIAGFLADVGAKALELGGRVLSKITSGAGDIAGAIGQKIADIPGALLDGTKAVVSAATNLGGKIFTAVIAGIGDIGGAVWAKISGAIHTGLSALRNFSTPRIDTPTLSVDLGLTTVKIPSFELAPSFHPFSAIPLAEGGVVRARPGGTLARLGEAGQDEAVVPLGRGMGVGGVTQNFYVQGPPDAGQIMALAGYHLRTALATR